MTDYLTDALAISALAGATGAVLLAVIEWFELRSAKLQIEAERRRIEQLGKLVETLASMVKTQQEQLSVLEKQARIANDVLKIQEADLALRKEQVEWEQKGPFAKARTWIDRWNEAREAKRAARRGW